MISPATAVVQLNGQTYRELISIELEQSINDHHHFTINISSDKIGEGTHEYLEKARGFIGNDLVLEISNKRDEKYVFSGIVTNVKTSAGNQSELGHIVIIEGKSPTILLDNGLHCQVYQDKTLKDIAEEVCRDFPVNIIHPEIAPLNKDKFTYIVQSLETPFNFLNRLACCYGEWFYFDGESLVFGVKNHPVTELLYGTDLMSFDINMSISPLVQSYSTRVYKDNSIQEIKIADQTSNMQGYASFAMDKSSKTFLGKPLAMLHQFDDDAAIGSQMDNVGRLAMQVEAARKVNFAGTSTDPAVFPGVPIAVFDQTASGKSKQGDYIVTSVSHKWESGGHYKNSFTAIPSDAEVPPTTNPIQFPLSSSQTAIVTDNNDPDGLGRIKVRFNWQKYGDSPWLRIAMPYTGKDKGMFFVPEAGEEVMVGFEGGNAEKPFIIGALYHGKMKPDSFANDENNFKAIRTRSGHTIEFDDTEGEESITIFDKEGTYIKFDTKEKSLLIKAIENLEIQGKNVTITAEKKLELLSEEDTTVGAKKNLQILADGALELQSKKDTTVTATGKVTIEATKDATLSGQNVTAEGKIKAELKGTQTTVEGKMTQVKGTAFMFDLK